MRTFLHSNWKSLVEIGLLLVGFSAGYARLDARAAYTEQRVDKLETKIDILLDRTARIEGKLAARQ